MNLIGRMALAALVAVALFVLPWGTAAADPDRGRGRQDPPGHERREENPKDDSDADSTQPEGSAEDENEDGSKAPEQRVSEKSDPNGRRSSRAQGEPQPEQSPIDERSASVQMDLAAAPSTLEAGQRSTITVSVVVENSRVEHAEVLVDLPQHLEFRSASHAVSATSGPLRFDLGSLDAGSRTAVTVVVEALRAPSGAQAPVRVAVTADGVVVRDEVAIIVGDESESSLALSQTSPLLVQVGDSGSFSLTLRNGSDQVVEDAVVVAEIAPELDVVGVAPIEEADAIQLGRSPAGEDIVWTFDELQPGAEVQLTWSARAVVAGDLEATMSARASAAGAFSASTTQTTYLGYVRGVRTDAGTKSAEPIVEERVVTKLVPVTREVSAAAATLLPVTGATPSTVLLIAGALILLGGALILLSVPTRRRKGLSVALLAIVLTASGCVSDGGDRVSELPQAEEVPATTPKSQDEKDQEKDRVLGLRIEREGSDGEGTEVPADPDDAAPVSPPATEVVLEEVTTVEQVVVPAQEVPPTTLGSREGDNRVSMTLGQGTPTVTSSRIISADATEELLVAAGGTPSELTASVSLRNLSEAPMVVRGTLVLEIASDTGATSELTSAPVDTVLQPGGETAASFSFALPDGGYALTGTFRAY